MFFALTYGGSKLQASVPVVEWLATENQKRKMEQGKGEISCPLFSGNPPPVISSAPPATAYVEK
jgi:hypothetical protein